MTLKDILQYDMDSNLSVLNSNADLQRVVSTIESTETPDVVSFVPANCFIVTTGMVYKNDQGRLMKLIETLNALPCAGLAIKLGRFLDGLEPEVIEKADQLQFPLLLIPKDRTLGQVYQNMLSILWNNQNMSLLEALNMKKKLYNLVINGATLKRILRNIGSEIGRHIMVIDAFGEHYVNGNASSREEKAGIQLVNQHGKDLVKIQEGQQYIWQESTHISVYPIQSISGNTNYLLTYDQSEQTPVSIFMMEEVVLLMEIILYKNLLTDFNDIQQSDEFRKCLLNMKGENWSLEQLLKWDQKIGFRVSSFYNVILCRYVDFTSYRFNHLQFMRREEKYIMGYKFMKSQLQEMFSDEIIVLSDLDNWQYMILMFSPCDDIEQELRKIADRFSEILRERVVFSRGGKAWDQESIRFAFWRAMENYRKTSVYEEMDMFIDMDSESVLEFLRKIPRMQTDIICRTTLKELAYPENETYLDLRRTLKVFLDCQCSITETASQLFLHRNTIRYRIRKCEDILGRNLDSSESCFEIQLALYLSERDQTES